MKSPLPNIPSHVVMAQMMAGFLVLAGFFFVRALFSWMGGSMPARSGAILRSESPELFAKLLGQTVWFGVAMLGVAAACGLISRHLKPKP
ncbi:MULTISPECIES: hypothetical protein [unclassified Brevundimonas]|uniref:hypothetical protein n=1 Tax=unclassified Brevundimonas TaxID=2622653 RepID=UPI0025C1147D|nr:MULTISPECIES: hypothetical protein [unclassified Brevundimonas]